MSTFVVQAGPSERDADLVALAQRLGVAVVELPSADACTLARDSEGLVLRARVAGGPAVVRADVARARRAVDRRTSLLARAVGGARGALVVDATAGLGRDAHELAALGYRVLACERHPVLAFLLRDALARTELAIELHAGDARDLLASLPAGAAHAVVLDPMFPARSKSAQVKKEAQVLQRLVGVETDTGALFLAAWSPAARIVVKRPLRAPPLAEGVTFVVAGRAVRFDVYLTAGRAMPPLTPQTPAP